MNYWIIPFNNNSFRCTDLLKKRDIIDWRQRRKFEKGDIVFLYNLEPYHAITHMMVVEGIDLTFDEYSDDKEFWNDLEGYEESRKNNRYVRLRLLHTAPSTKCLGFDSLRKKGLNNTLQTSSPLKEKKLISFIMKHIVPDSNDKIARICWNDNGWTRPSGSKGKSTGENYESINGYGHEEWLLDRSKIDENGYHYGFLEPLSKSSFSGTKNIHLYAKTPQKRRRYVGCIRNAEYLTKEEAKNIKAKYQEKGWFDSMLQDIEKCGIEAGNFNLEFNVRFKFENFEDALDRELYIDADDDNLQNEQYIFLNKRIPFRFEISDKNDFQDVEDIVDVENRIPEGAKSRIVVNRYERNHEARKQCLEKKGYSCCVCGMNFEDVYGSLGKEFIHVHHIVPLSEIGHSYEVDPVKDLVPVCPNCHAMLHKGIDGRVLSIDELRAIIKKPKEGSLGV